MTGRTMGSTGGKIAYAAHSYGNSNFVLCCMCNGDYIRKSDRECAVSPVGGICGTVSGSAWSVPGSPDAESYLDQ